ncbi:sensor histidine kinase [Methylobacterium sp. CM6247]
MAERVRVHDWSATPLGPLAAWSDRLKLMVEQVLASPLVATLVCGPERILIYNDAAVQIYGDRHPSAFGRPLPMAFPEGWATVAPFYARAFAGETVKVESQTLDTRGEGDAVDTFDALLMPVRENDGSIAYVHLIGAEAGARMKAEAALHASEERLAADLADATLLRDLAARLVTEEDVETIHEEILSAAIAIMRSDAGTVQVYDPRTKSLVLLVTRNLERTMTDHFRRLDASSRTACGIALRTGERTFIDFNDDDTDEACIKHVEAGYRSAQATPLVSRTGTPLGMLNTHWREARHRPNERQLGFLDLLARQAADLIDQRQVQRTLRESEERLRLAVDVGRLATWDWNVDTGAVSWSDEHYRVHGYAVGEVTPSYEAWAARVHPKDLEDVENALIRARDEHREYTHEFRTLHPDGTIRWCDARGQFFYDPGGRPLRMIGTMLDTTERRVWAERQQVLISELQHRTRNLLGVVRSIAQQTMAKAGPTEAFREQFNERLSALSRVQGLLSRSDQEPITIGALIRTELDALGAGAMQDRIHLDGPPVRLRKAHVQTLALALHELATNARKYGALTTEHGQLRVTWRTYATDDDGQRLALEWVEDGISRQREEQSPVTRGGYGRELIERALPYALGARTRYELGETQVRCSIDLPLTERTDKKGSP